MKKILAMAMAMVMSLGLVACGAKEAPATTPDAPATDAPATEAAKVVVFWYDESDV